MKKIKDKYISFINEKIEEYKCASEVLKNEGRDKEAGLEKAKAGIFELFKTLFIIDTHQLDGKDLSGYKDISLFADYMLHFETVTKNWREFLEKAKECGDTDKQKIEEVKLEAVMELKDKFISIVNGSLDQNQPLKSLLSLVG